MACLSKKESELVALGASIGSNCIPCIANHVAQAKEALGRQCNFYKSTEGSLRCEKK